VGDNGEIGYHATHVAGTVIGSGSGNPQAHGMAAGARLVSYDWASPETEMVQAVATYGIQLSTNSWGWINGWSGNIWWGDERFGLYSSDSQSWDNIVFSTGLTIVWAAGNDRDDVGDQSQAGHKHAGSNVIFYDYHPPDGDYDCVDTNASAKNVIAVGALSDDAQMLIFSSWGPTDDGRIKPDFVTNGEYLLSTSPTNTYTTMSGTSMATPTTTGSIALMLEQYRNTFGSNPSPAMIRALVANTSVDLGNPGPDYSYGWGLVDTLAAVDLIRSGIEQFGNASIAHGNTINYPITVSSPGNNLKVTIAWTDPVGDPAAARALERS
jgi:subtilisin family serine protease